MAKSTLLESGEIVPVYFPMGKFDNDQRRRFMRAPFVFLKLNNDEYVMPTTGASDARDLSNILSTDSFNLEQLMSRNDFGFESDDNIVVGDHELGDFNNPTWKGVHRFGII